MKYMCIARPGPLPPSPEQFDATFEWLQGQLDDGTEVRPVLAFGEGEATIRAKPVEAQAAMGGRS
ncbi:MAG TPA: hypothetical protein VGH14_12865 [Solirubrobacterales bacterium]|jgi:hypothetical protein